MTIYPKSLSMKNRITHLAIIASMMLLTSKVHSQDLHFSQFFETPLLRNPALAGLFNGDLRLQSVFRTQWQSVTVPYKTGSVNGEYKLLIGKRDDYITLGAQILYDRAGSVSMTSTQFMPVLNYHKSLGAEKSTYLSLGFMGGIVQRKLDRSKITTNSQFDGNAYNPNLSDGESFSNSSYSYFDGTVGLSFSTQVRENPDDNFFLGVSYHHFNKAKNISFYNNPENEITPKWVLSSGIRMSTNDYSYVTFHTDYAMQGPYTELIGGLVYSRKFGDVEDPRYMVHGGLLYRWNDAVIPTAKVELRPFAISLSYDANVSKLITASKGRGGFEMGISYIKFLDRNNSTKNAVKCPKF